jgi:hypothetical protein
MPTKKTAPKAATRKATAPKTGASKPAAAKAAPDPEPAAAPLNREQRRAQKFGKAGKVHQHDPAVPWPENATNPALASTTEDQAGGNSTKG